MKNFLRTLFALSACAPPALHAQQTFEVSYHNNAYSHYNDLAWLRNDAVAGVSSHIDNSGFEVAALSAFTPNGQLLWDKTYPNTVSHMFTFEQLRPTRDGGLLVCGSGSDPVSGNVYDPFLLKTDSLGQTQWAKVYNSIHSEYNIGNVRQTSDGGFVCAGVAYGSNPTDFWYYLLKTDSMGNREWGKTYHHSNPSKIDLTDVYEDENGDYFACGHLDDTALVMKVSHTGAFLWTRRVRMGNIVFSFPQALGRSHTPGAFVCAGRTTNRSFAFEMDTLGNLSWLNMYDYFLTEDLVPSPGSGYVLTGFKTLGQPNGILVKISNTGQLSWNRVYPTSYMLVALDTLYNGDGYAACGSHQGSLGVEFGYLLRTDTMGKLYCNEINASLLESAPAVVIDTLMLSTADYFTVNTYDVPSAEYLVRDSLICAGTVGYTENFSPGLKVWPVPADEKLFLELPDDAQWQITLSDALGRMVLQKNLRGKKHELDLIALPPGIYLLQAKSGEKIVTKKILRR